MGGGLALAIAADYPGLVEKIVVVDALPCLAALMDASFQSEDTLDCTALVDQIVSASDEDFYEMQKNAAQRLAADSSKWNIIVSWSMHSDRNTFAEMFCDFSNTDLRETIARIECPSLILMEAYFGPLQAAIDDQYQNLKNKNILYADRGLHFIMYDDVEWYSNQLKDFISVD
jgi:pimeloyl-ACP methyl ester carboxylesterase